MEKSEFYVKTLLSLYKADMLSLNRLSELVEAEVWEVNPVVWNNILYYECNNKLDIDITYEDIVKNIMETMP